MKVRIRRGELKLGECDCVTADIFIERELMPEEKEICRQVIAEAVEAEKRLLEPKQK